MISPIDFTLVKAVLRVWSSNRPSRTIRLLLRVINWTTTLLGVRASSGENGGSSRGNQAVSFTTQKSVGGR